MPIYEFECKACGHQFEELVLPWIQKDGEAQPTACPSCKAQNVERMLSAFAVNSESTRQHSLNKAREKARAVKKEKDTEEFKQVLEHAAEHH